MCCKVRTQSKYFIKTIKIVFPQRGVITKTSSLQILDYNFFCKLLMPHWELQHLSVIISLCFFFVLLLS